MADKKISDLNHLNIAASDDLFVVVDVDQAETKNIRKDALFGSPGPIGSANRSTGRFSTLWLDSGVSVSEILDEDNLGSDSETALATQQSIKAYVDSQIGSTQPHNLLSGLQGGDSTSRYHLTMIEHNELTGGGYTSLHQHSPGSIVHDDLGGLKGGDSTGRYHLTMVEHDELTSGGVTSLHTHSGAGLDHNTLTGLQGGDSTSEEFYHLTQGVHDGLYSASPVIGLGSSTGTNLEVDYGSNQVSIDVNGSVSATFDVGVELYYDGTKTFRTTKAASNAGIRLFDETETEMLDVLCYNSTGNTVIANNATNGDINFLANDSGDVQRALAYLDPNGSVDLFHAGTKTLSTELVGDDGGLRIHSGSNQAFFRVNASNGDVEIENFASNGRFSLLGVNSGLTETTLTAFDPNGAAQLFFAGSIAFSTTAGGINVYDDNGDDPFIGFYDDSSVRQGWIQFRNGTEFEIRETINDKNILLHTFNAGVELYYNGVKAFSTQSDGVYIYASASPFNEFRMNWESSTSDTFDIWNTAQSPAGGITRFYNQTTGDVKTLMLQLDGDNGVSLNSGTSITEFSTDGTLSGDSDSAVPTEQAVKTYVDAQIGGSIEHNNLVGLQGGDSTSQFYHLTQEIHDQIDSTPNAILLSDGLKVEGHGAIGNTASIDIPGFPEYKDLLELAEDFDSSATGLGRGLVVQIDSAASNAATILTGASLVAQLDNSALHGSVKGLESYGFVNANSVVLTNAYGSESVASAAANNGTITNVIASKNSTRGGFGMVNVSVSKMAVGEYQLLDLGTGDISITDAYGILVRSPGFVPTGTVTNSYGLYIEDQTSLGNDNWNIYSAGATSKNVIEGDLHVGGNVTIDGEISSAVTGRESLIQGDTTASIVFDSTQADINYVVVGNLVNNTDENPSLYVHIIRNETIYGFDVLFSGPIDSANYEFSWILHRN